MSEELKPCPFCGNTDEVYGVGDRQGTYCDNCGADGPSYVREGKPVAVWNDRHTPAELEPGAVPIPTSTDMARMMLALGHRYLKENAPEQLAQPAPASTGRIPVVESANLVTIRTRLKSAAQAGAPITLSGLSACALYYAMDTGMPMASDDPAPVAARELDVEAERRELPAILFDGHAVYSEITRHLGKAHCHNSDTVSATLDAVVRLMRAESAQVSTEQAAGAPGWQTVPAMPTLEMQQAALEAARSCRLENGQPRPLPGGYELWSATYIYRVMLEAAPSPNNSPVGADRRE